MSKGISPNISEWIWHLLNIRRWTYQFFLKYDYHTSLPHWTCRSKTAGACTSLFAPEDCNPTVQGWSRCNGAESKADMCHGQKSLYRGCHLTFHRNLNSGYINPYYWVDHHPILYGNNGSLRPWHIYKEYEIAIMSTSVHAWCVYLWLSSISEYTYMLIYIYI